jgi:hypothetical protein
MFLYIVVFDGLLFFYLSIYARFNDAAAGGRVVSLFVSLIFFINHHINKKN